MKKTSDCIYCGGEIVQTKDRIDYRYHGQLFIMENIPLGVCNQCGEKFLSSEVAKKLEKAAATPNEPLKTVAIPVIPMSASF